MPVATPAETRTYAEWGDLARTLVLLDADGETRRLAVAGILRVLTRGSANPPSSPTPAEGDMHLMGAGVHPNELAYRTAAGTWQYLVPGAGCAWKVQVVSEAHREYTWRTSSWVADDEAALDAAADAQAVADAALPSSSFDYTHTQSPAAATWTINHNLGRRPLVELRTAGGLRFEAELLHVSDNQVVVSLASAITGTARCV